MKSTQLFRNKKQTMKRNLVTFAAAGVIALSGLAIALAEDGSHDGHGWHRHGGLDQMTETLNLTPDQKAKVQPILDQAKPQIIAIHQDAMQKTKAIMDSTMSQIRPLLNPDQQQKLDNIRQAHENMRKAMKDLHDAKKS